MSNADEGRWVRGLIHLHSTYSDGHSTVEELKHLARGQGYDYMIVTDHAEDGKLIPALQQYVSEVEGLSEPNAAPPFLAIPGMEIAAGWTLLDKDGAEQDKSTAHTLALDVTDHVDFFRAPNGPLGPKATAAGSAGQLLDALQGREILACPAHTFQYTSLKADLSDPLEGSDFRYDMSAFPKAPHVDIFYRTVLEMDHEPEDVALYTGLINRWHRGGRGGTTPLAFTSCDYHAGWPSFLGELGGHMIDWLGGHLPDSVGIAVEQVSHTTWTLVKGDLTREHVIDALRHGRTFVTRGTANVVVGAEVWPPPGDDEVTRSEVPGVKVTLAFDPPTTRPMFCALYRDGVEVSGFRQTFSKGRKEIVVELADPDAAPGVHCYVAQVEGKMVSSPVLIEKI